MAGHPKKEGVAENWLMKDPKKNQVCLLDSDPGRKDAVRIKTGWKRLETFAEGSYLEVELFTGKTHQIRAQMAALGYPPVSYTHLDVYKRQRLWRSAHIYGRDTF